MSIERSVTSTDGTTIAYRRVGTGPALVVVTTEPVLRRNTGHRSLTGQERTRERGDQRQYGRPADNED